MYFLHNTVILRVIRLVTELVFAIICVIFLNFPESFDELTFYFFFFIFQLVYKSEIKKSESVENTPPTFFRNFFLHFCQKRAGGMSKKYYMKIYLSKISF